jgi:histidyl-tRNA synthetase
MSLSGFPEWLPAQRIVELSFLDSIRRTFELHGFASLETRSVEPLDQLLRKGEVDKEVYVLRRLHAGDDEGDAGLGLHFDLTVPFARYVLENAGHLDFPFRRYQVQRAWRGERPQEGRYREFVQADIDVVDRDTLAGHHEVEIPLVVGEALRALPIPPPVIQVNNRKLAEGFFRGVGAHDPGAVLRAVDKLDKIGPAAVSAQLVADAGLSASAAKACLNLAGIRSYDPSFADAVRALGVRNSMLDEGLAELVNVIEQTSAVAPGLVMADLRIARGLDYYTGTVYETVLSGYEGLGSVCSGGRYDSLASDGKSSYPGVGMSIGVSRILGLVLGRDLVEASRKVPSCVLVAVADEAARPAADQVAAQLRARGIPCEVAPAAAKFGKQIRHADRRGIPYVWFAGAGAGDDSVKDIRSGDQVPADPAAWQPPEQDRWPTVGSVVSESPVYLMQEEPSP